MMDTSNLWLRGSQGIFVSFTDLFAIDVHALIEQKGQVQYESFLDCKI